MSELKPCPFCKEIPKLESGYVNIEKLWWVEPCDCITMDFCYPTKEEAIEAWNRRANDV